MKIINAHTNHEMTLTLAPLYGPTGDGMTGGVDYDRGEISVSKEGCTQTGHNVPGTSASINGNNQIFIFSIDELEMLLRVAKGIAY